MFNNFSRTTCLISFLNFQFSNCSIWVCSICLSLHEHPTALNLSFEFSLMSDIFHQPQLNFVFPRFYTKLEITILMFQILFITLPFHHFAIVVFWQNMWKDLINQEKPHDKLLWMCSYTCPTSSWNVWHERGPIEDSARMKKEIYIIAFVCAIDMNQTCAWLQISNHTVN